MAKQPPQAKEHDLVKWSPVEQHLWQNGHILLKTPLLATQPSKVKQPLLMKLLLAKWPTLKKPLAKQPHSIYHWGNQTKDGGKEDFPLMTP